MARIAAVAFVTFALLAPRLSEACAVCSFSDDGSQRGFMLGTLIMTTLPFLVIGSIVFFVRRRMRGAGAGEAPALERPVAAQPLRDFGSLRGRVDPGPGFSGARSAEALRAARSSPSSSLNGG